MARDPKDPGTCELVLKRGPGRPRKANAKSGAQRQREFRRNRKATGGAVFSLSLDDRGDVAFALAVALELGGSAMGDDQRKRLQALRARVL